MRSIDLRVVELIAARLCHDLIGPISAISNGAELLADEEPEFARDAAALVGDSAKKALRNLQFYRFAYAFSGGALAGPAPHLLAAEFFAQTAIECDYRAEARGLPLDQQKLATATGGEHYIETVWGRGYVLRDPVETAAELRSA